MSLILGMAGGIGEQAANMGQQLFKDSLDSDRETRTAALARETHSVNSGVDLMRQKALEDYREVIKNAPLNRMTARVQQRAGEDVPVQAAPVTSLSGAGHGSDVLSPTGGLTGTYADLVKEAANLPPEDREPYMAQLKKQFGADTEKAQSIVAGQMRRRSPDEALQAAADDMKTSDLPAYAAYEKEIGKPAREERKLDTAEKREEARAAAVAKEGERKAAADAQRFAIEAKKLDLQGLTLEASNRKIDALIDHWERGDENKANATESKSEGSVRLYSVINSMNQQIKQLDDGPKGKTDDEKKAWQEQRDNAVKVRARATAKLNSILDEGAGPPPPTPAPAAAPTASRPPLSNFLKK